MNVKATNVGHFDQLKNPGDYIYTNRVDGTKNAGMLFVCPCGCGEFGAINFKPLDKQPVWTFDGNLECPTVTPSIHKISGCGWHGYLTKGEFVQC